MEWKPNAKIKPSKMKNSLAIHVTTHSIIKKMVNDIQNIPSYEQLKLDKELTKNVCKDVLKLLDNDKNLTSLNKKDLSKTSIVSEILKQSFDLTDDELQSVKDDINFMLNNNLIKKKSLIGKSLKILSKIL